MMPDTSAASPAGEDALLVRDLRVSIRGDAGRAYILDGVDLTVPKGKIVGLVGESGCGKSTVGRAILGILPKEARIDAGEIRLGQTDLLALDSKTFSRDIRGRVIGFIPQDPFQSLNPVFTVGQQLLEIMRWHAPDTDGPITHRMFASSRRHRDVLRETLAAVHIPDPEAALDKYPHQFSGGQRQRILIAAALACRPKLIVADEPTTALDVTTQQQLLELLRRLVAEYDLSVLLITHDFGVVAEICDSVRVMYSGQTVEEGRAGEVIDNPRHPYARALLHCHPDLGGGMRGIPGTVPSPLNPPTGCRFRPRCEHTMPVCGEQAPAASRFSSTHTANCYLYRSESPVAVASNG